ncbi:MAG TPA: hypothetical protein VKP69_02230 [Isosphaeraceae bacterium]|nr:hypothetical protein [Isosphaeraceae bacterium]
MPAHEPERPAPLPCTATPIRDLGLSIAGSALEPILAEFEAERQRAGLRRIRPRFYLSTEWGVPEGTVAIAIPFYLARADLTALHAERVGHVEGTSWGDILRYLRHEMGHVVNYAYRLFDTPEWVARFGAIGQAYRDEYRVEPFSRRHVRHLPGWYAQKHPDEDWSETFAVWLTPGLDWRADYAGWPEALAKLDYCDRTMAALADRDPVVTADELDLDVGEVTDSVEQFYDAHDVGAWGEFDFPSGLDAAFRSIFEDLGSPESAPADRPRRLASALVRRLERDLMTTVYRWTGHFPERTRPLVRHLADRAEALTLDYPERRETEAVVALTTLITTLAMNFVQRGTYIL